MKKQTKIVIAIISIIVVLFLGFYIYFKISYMSKQEIKEVIVDYMNAKEKDIFFETVDLEFDSGLYEVDLYYQNQEYEFKVDAKKGSIVQTDYIKQNLNDSSKTNMQTPSTNVEQEITEEEAKKIAFDDAKVTESDVQRLRIKKEYDDHHLVYEIDFMYGTYEYDYKIQASDGSILEYDKDSIYD